MNRNTGTLGAMVLAIAAVFSFSVLPSGKGELPATTSAPSKSSEPAAAPNQEPISPCLKINRAIADFVSTTGLTLPTSCSPKSDKHLLAPFPGYSTGTKGLRYIIATLPDPVHTHFPLLFDRLTEALQQGAQDQGYNYDDSWLPWEDEPPVYSGLNDQLRAKELLSQQEEQPGVLVFRKAIPSSSDGTDIPYQGGLIVFVVGENPTGGINQKQFQNAVCWVESLQKQNPDGKDSDQDPRILGPYFSGSLPSLARAITMNNLLAMPQQAENCGAHQPAAEPAPGKVTNHSHQRTIAPAKVGEKETFAPRLGTKGLADVRPATNSVAVSSDALFLNSEDRWFERFLGSPPDAQPGDRFCYYLRTASYENGELRALCESSQEVPPPLHPLNIYSGSVSSRSGIEWFNRFLAGNPATFYSFQENDDVMIDRYCRYLNALGYDTGKIAILAEDETAYGEQAPKEEASEQFSSCADPLNSPSHGPLYLYYPRDIAALRSAYEKQAPGSLGIPQNQTGNTGLGLPLNLAEPGSRQHDTIRTYGQEQTPLSQEATLLGLTKLFSSHDIHFIILRSSNTLDQVFLTQFFSKAYPEARVVLTSTDLLFRRSSETAGFRGTTTLSTYPLFTWQQDWTHWQSPESRHSHRAFAEDTAEGLYLAMRFLIDGKPYSGPERCPDHNCLQLTNSSVAIQDYAPPSWLLPKDTTKNGALTVPPTWLSVIGSEQFWPVAVLDNSVYLEPECLKCPPNMVGGPTPTAAYTPRSTLPRVFLSSVDRHNAELVSPLAMKVFLFLCLLWAGWHLLGCYLGSKQPCRRLLSSVHFPGNFALMREQKRRQIRLIFISGLVMVTFAILVANLAGLLGESRTREGQSLLGLATVAMVLCPLLGFYLVCKRRQSPPPEPSSLKQQIAWFVLSIAVSGLIVYWVIPHHLSCYNSIFVYWRSLNLLNGVAPVVPMTLLMAGLYSWCWFSLSGLALFNGDRPQLPRYPETPRRKTTGPVSSGMEVGRKIELRAIPLGPKYGTRLFYVLIGLVLCKILVFTRPFNQQDLDFQGWAAFLLDKQSWISFVQALGVRSLGNRWYGLLFFAYVTLCVGLMLLDGGQLLSTWYRLRQLLIALDQLPLRRTLVTLKGFSWDTVWKMGGDVLQQRNGLIARQMESLIHLTNQLENIPQDTPEDVVKVAELRKSLTACEDLIEEYSGLSRNLENDTERKPPQPAVETHAVKLSLVQRKLAATATLVLNKLLIDTWRKEKHSLLRPAVKPDSGNEKSDDKAGAVAVPPEYFSAAEEFFVLPCLGFIQNILGRIRTMVIGMMFLFVAAALSAASYPFDPRPELGAIFLTVFMVNAAIIIFVYAQMHRDATLSNITDTKPGELGSEFWIKLLALGAGPAFALMATLFPQIATFITSWLQPGVQAIK